MKLADYIPGIKREIDAEKTRLQVLMFLGDVGEIQDAYVAGYSCEVKLTPQAPDTARDLALRVARNIMAIPGTAGMVKAEKSFDADRGKVTYTVLGPIVGWKVLVAGGDPRCKIKKIVEEVVVPEKIVPAHTVPARIDQKVTYVIENPEECGASMGGE